MTRCVAGLVALVLALLTATLAAQQPVFEAATIKPNHSASDRSSIGQRPGGQYVMENGPIFLLLMNAFRPENREIVGAPTWVTSERYDLRATANATTASDTMRLMLRSLLADRLKLQAHLEARELPVYFLVPVRADKQLGPRIERTSRDCAAVAAADQANLPRPMVTPPANGAPPCGMGVTEGTILGGGQTMAGLARNLGSGAGRPVFDRTGIDGLYDFTLKYARPQDGGDTNAPSFFTALQEQLALKLEPGRAPLQTLVIDHIERPSEN